MPVDDYYALIGVPPDADRDTIRDAYRSRRSELDDTESGRSNAAKLNRAWNVLSDGAQRARYDDELATAKADDNVIVPEIVGATRGSTNGRGPARAARGAARDKGAKRPVREPRQPVMQAVEVNGVALASNRDRGISLAIDAVICIFILVIGVSVVAQKMADSSKPEVVARIDVLQKTIDNDQKSIDNNIKLRDAAKSKADKDRYNTAKKAAEKKFDADTKLQTTEKAKLDGLGREALAGAGLLALLLFAVPTAMTGKTLGKALRKIHLVKEDGVTLPGWSTAFIRYGAIFGFIVAAGVFLGQVAQLAWIVAIFGVTSFSRNPKRQGWHDRIARTLVVAD